MSAGVGVGVGVDEQDTRDDSTKHILEHRIR